MKIFVTAKPNSRTRRVTEIDQTHIIVSVDAPARYGKANARLIEIIAEHYNIPARSLRIIAGLKSRKKIVELQ